jgi:hypothetical protein
MHEREGRVSALTTLLSFAFLITTEEQRSAYLMALEMLGQPDEIADAQNSFEEILRNAQREAENKRGDNGHLGGGGDSPPSHGGGVDGISEDVGVPEGEEE